jgi:hypothetical protein
VPRRTTVRLERDLVASCRRRPPTPHGRGDARMG